MRKTSGVKERLSNTHGERQGLEFRAAVAGKLDDDAADAVLDLIVVQQFTLEEHPESRLRILSHLQVITQSKRERIPSRSKNIFSANLLLSL